MIGFGWLHQFVICYDSAYIDGKKRKVIVYGSKIDIGNYQFPYSYEGDDDQEEFTFETKGEMLDYLKHFPDCVHFDAATGQRVKNQLVLFIYSNRCF